MEARKPDNFAVPARRYVQVALQGAIELLLFFPIVLWLYLTVSPLSLGLWIVVLVGSYVLGAIFGPYVRLSRAIYLMIASAIAAVIVVLLIYIGNYAFGMIVAWLFLTYIMYRGASMTVSSWRQMFPISACCVGLIVYFIAAIAANNAESWAPYVTAIQTLGIISLAATLLRANRHHLQLSAPAGYAVSKLITVRNAMWLGILFLVILLVSYFQIIGTAFRSILLFIAYVVGYIMSLLIHPTELKPSQVENPLSQIDMGTEMREPSFWDKFFDVALTVFAIALLVGLAAFILVVVGRYLWKVLRKALRKRNLLADGVGYVDEKRKLTDSRESGGGRWRRKLAGMFKRETRWRDLPDWRERVRWLYKRKVQTSVADGYVFLSQRTAHETMQAIREEEGSPDEGRFERLADAYDRARYGGPNDEVAGEVLERLYRDTFKKE